MKKISELPKLISYLVWQWRANGRLHKLWTSKEYQELISFCNLMLSKNRAQAVVDYLVTKGIAISRLNAVGFGEDKPVTTNNTAEGRTLNRRVKLILTEN